MSSEGKLAGGKWSLAEQAILGDGTWPSVVKPREQVPEGKLWVSKTSFSSRG